MASRNTEFCIIKIIYHSYIKIRVYGSGVSGTGTKIFLMKIEFFQEVNGVQYSMKNGSYNALKIVAVG